MLRKTLKRNKGITLIALVVTIIVLLILAGISISLLAGQNGILNRATQAKEENEESKEKEEIGLAVTASRINENGYEEINQSNLQKAINDQFGEGKVNVQDNGDGTFLVYFNNKSKSYKIISNGNIIEKSEIPKGIKVGDIVAYTANDSNYIWQGKYSGEAEEINVTLNNTNDEYKITEWKVYDLNNSTGTIELISSNATTGKVFLGYAQGYNNAVYLLNEACNKLYGNVNKGIIGRNINIEDIENKMTEEALDKEENSAHKYLNAYGYSYGSKANNAYALNASTYPEIYAQEKLSVIDGKTNENGIGASKQFRLVEKADTLTNKLQATKNIQPYHSNWYKNNAFMQNAFKSLNNNNEKTYYELVMPEDAKTSYWVSTRVVGLYEESCGFSIRYVNSGNIGAFFTCSSYNNTDTDQGIALPMRPIISVDASMIAFNEDLGWMIK